MPDQAAVFLHNEIQIRNEIRIVPVTMKHVVLSASGTIYIPERFTGKILYRTVILGLFKSYCHNFKGKPLLPFLQAFGGFSARYGLKTKRPFGHVSAGNGTNI